MNSKDKERQIDERETTGILSVMIIEVLGRPPEHLIQTLEEILKKLGEEKGVKINDKKIREPNLVKDKKDLYTSFLEVEVEVEEISKLAGLIFNYMPAHIEILSPELIQLTNSGWSDILNEIIGKLHRYDEVAKIINVEKSILENKLRELLKEKKEGN